MFCEFYVLGAKYRVICEPRHWNLGIGIGTDIANTVISSFIRPMDPKLSRVVT